jgi:hypothetical protein
MPLPNILMEIHQCMLSCMAWVSNCTADNLAAGGLCPGHARWWVWQVVALFAIQAVALFTLTGGCLAHTHRFGKRVAGPAVSFTADVLLPTSFFGPWLATYILIRLVCKVRVQQQQQQQQHGLSCVTFPDFYHIPE